MKKLIAVCICIIWSFAGFSQEKTNSKKFAATEKLIVYYSELGRQALEKGDEKLYKIYDDSVANSIVGSYVESHTFTTIDSKEVSLATLDKPVFLMASATWCTPCKAEVPALNKIAEEYAENITFIVLFHDTKEKLEKVKKDYDPRISLVPSVTQNEEPTILNIAGFRHITGFPTNYLVNKERLIVGYSQGATAPMSYTNANGEKVTIDQQRANEINYARLKEEVEQLLLRSKRNHVKEKL